MRLMAMVCAHVVISGKVQGVYYRVSAQKKALSLNLTGWVRNLPDGSVEGVVQGEKERVEEMLAWCRQGPPSAAVTGQIVDWPPYTGEYSTFIVAPDKV